MKIACSMIAYNEEDYIAQAIESIAPFTDFLAIVDGESTDGTLQVVLQACKDQNLMLEIKQHKWANDFGQQRQYALDIVPEHFDWWFRIDADEQFPGSMQDNFRDILSGVPEDTQAINIRQVNLLDVDNKARRFYYSASRGGWETHPRIFRNLRLPDGNPAWRWRGQVHEYCQLMTRQGLVYPEQIAYWNVGSIHFGWLDKQRRVDRENLYEQIPGSGFVQGSLTERTHIVRELPQRVI